MAGYELNQPYQHNFVNGQVRHNVPLAEITVGKDRKSIIVLDAGTVFNLQTDEYGDQTFIAELSRCQPLELEPVVSTWQYHERNVAQDILPFLFLGPMAAARDPAFIQSNHFTMIVAVRDGNAAAINPKIMDPARFASATGIETVTFDMLHEYDLIRRFRLVVKQINDHLMAGTTIRPVSQLSGVGGKILVFCEAGDRRSAALVTLYLMAVFGLPGTSAIQAVQARRYGININGELLRLIQNFGEILQAERQASSSGDISNFSNDSNKEKSRKRRIERVQEEEEEAMNTMFENGSNTHRAGVAPFKDTGIQK